MDSYFERDGSYLLPTARAAGAWNADPWDDNAVELLDQYVETEPFLVRISAAKRARDRVEQDAKRAREGGVTAARVEQSLAAMAAGRAA